MPPNTGWIYNLTEALEELQGVTLQKVNAGFLQFGYIVNLVNYAYE